MRAGVTGSISPVPSFTVSPAAQLVPVLSSTVVPLSLQSQHPFAAACSCASQGGSREASAMAEQSRHGGTLGTCPPRHVAASPHRGWSHLQAPAPAQLEDTQWDQPWGRAWWARKVLFSLLKSPKLPKSSSKSLNNTIIFLDNVIELFLVTAAWEIQMVSPIFSAAYTQEQLQESECKLCCIHGRSIPSKNLLLSNLGNFFFFWQGLIQDA